MCNVTYFQSQTCNHIWAVISHPCMPFMGFTTCPSFSGPGQATMKNTSLSESTPIKKPTGFYKTRTRPCPTCDLGGVYDYNAVRMVTRMGWGMTFGKDPSEGDWGVDLRLGTVKKGCVIL